MNHDIKKISHEETGFMHVLLRLSFFIFLACLSCYSYSAEHAIHFWTSSQGTVVEQNLIINCDRGIGFGLDTSPHLGGIIRNNMIYHSGSGEFPDAGIGIESSSDTWIYNNTIIMNHSRYNNAIEYRFTGTTNTINSDCPDSRFAEQIHNGVSPQWHRCSFKESLSF